MRVEYEPSGLIAVKSLGLAPIAFAGAMQVWVDKKHQPERRQCQDCLSGPHLHGDLYPVSDDMTVFFIVNVQA